MSYFEMVKTAKDSLKVEFLLVIDNNTLKQSFCYRTNLHCDYGIADKISYSMKCKNKKQYRKTVSKFKRATGRKLKLVGTDNDINYTRIIYNLG